MKYEKIPRHDDQPYLDRWIIFRCRWFGILLHKFVGSDDECLHDHPWPFVTILIKGGYREWVHFTDSYLLDGFLPHHKIYELGDGHLITNDPNGRILIGTWYPRFSVLWRPANWMHRVEFDSNCPATSLIFHGPKVRSWGFDTKQGWKHHSEYSYKQHCE